ncbi:MAG: DNA glycosylase AlkZ-like family protein [Symbiobacteriia bacterium]
MARRYIGAYGPAGAEDFAHWAGISRVDTYLLGYRNRDHALDPKFSRRIHPGGGWIHPGIVVDGRVVGSWRAQVNRDALTVTAQPFEKFDRKLLPHLEAEADEVGRFLGLDAGLGVHCDLPGGLLAAAADNRADPFRMLILWRQETREKVVAKTG